LDVMQVSELFGYAASLLVFAAFYMKCMVPLRVVAIASNIAFITYAWIDGLIPILVLHGALLPLNLLRLFHLRRLEHKVERAVEDERSIELLLPLMRRVTIRSAEMLCGGRCVSDELYYIVRGTLYLPEVKKEIGPGFWFGEIALFSHSEQKTVRAVAKTECIAMVLTGKAALAALSQQPQLGIPLLRIVMVTTLQNADFQTKLFHSETERLRA
jgi:CRP/FNR family cyclic AMP-dependent transcriptional regulator